MPSLNKVILIGNLCADPELKQTPSGGCVTSFAIGVQRRFKNADGNYDSDFINIVAWRQTAEFICKYFRKGKPVVICGSIQTRSYTDRDGNKRYATEVIADEAGFATSASENAPVQPQEQKTEPAQTPGAGVQEAAKIAGQQPVQPHFEEVSGDEDLPF